jgi:hypothetical protein
VNVGNLHRFVEGLAHIVNRKGGASGGDKRFHFNAGLRSSRHFGKYFYSIFAQAWGHINVGERDGVTKRYPLRGAFGSGDARDAGDLQRIALGILEAANRANHPRRHANKSVGDGGARGDGFGRDVDHVNFTAFAVVRKLGHRVVRP